MRSWRRCDRAVGRSLLASELQERKTREIGIRRRKNNDGIAAIESWNDSLLSQQAIAGVKADWKRGEHEAEQLVRMTLAAANRQLHAVELESSSFWQGLQMAVAERIASAVSNPLAQDGLMSVDDLKQLEREIECRNRCRAEEEKRASARRLRAATESLFARFEGKNDRVLRAAVGEYVAAAETRARIWSATERTLRQFVPGFPGDDAGDRRGVDRELDGAVDLIETIDGHLRDVDADKEQERLLSVSTEHAIRRMLREYVRAVKAGRRRDLRNASVPLASFVVFGFVTCVAGKTEAVRSTSLFSLLAQVLPVLLLAITVEVRFLAERGLTRVVTSVTIVLVSLGFGACIYVLVENHPSPVTAGIAVGAAAAGLIGFVVAALSRGVRPREVFGAPE